MFNTSFNADNWRVGNKENRPVYYEDGDGNFIVGSTYEDEDGNQQDGTKIAGQRTFDADLLELIRHIRNLELEATDKFLMEDYPISAGKKTKMETYRQALRDIPDNGPFDITEEAKIDLSFWPTVPEL